MSDRPPDLKAVDGGGEPLPEAAVRGAAVIPGRVVARLTSQAAREALTRWEGVPPARAGLDPPRCSATVHHGRARVTVWVDLTYPLDIAGACSTLAHDITQRVCRLTGLHIDDTTVSVRRLVLKESLRQRRVR